MRAKGLEPPRLAPRAPKARVSTNSTTPAERVATDRRKSTPIAVVECRLPSGMAQKNVRVEYPNRDKSASRLMRLVVVAALLVSAALILIVTVLGWDLMQGAKTLNVVFVVLDLVFVIQVLRWSRGVLPMAAALAAFVGIFAAVSIGPWYARDAAGFTDAGLSATLGLLTAVILAVQIAVIVLSIYAFTQNWQIEIERRRRPDTDDGERRRRDALPA
jgi:hypothetical protein